ncbi:putative leucine-rich repeat-containing protein DDB_G0290503 [Atheta coriaria]|uniref:putative leucine-rich repeat-containing protein DDB_G0290503 n=1 Tax=Dalotia coriaria TaxID=877792 RepID=UPI0031F36A16
MNPIDFVKSSRACEDEILHSVKKAKLHSNALQRQKERSAKDGVIKLIKALTQKAENGIQILEIKKSGLKRSIEQESSGDPKEIHSLRVDLLKRQQELIRKYSKLRRDEVDFIINNTTQTEKLKKCIETAKTLKTELLKSKHSAQDNAEHIYETNNNLISAKQQTLCQIKQVEETKRSSLAGVTKEIEGVTNAILTHDILIESVLLDNQQINEMLHSINIRNFTKDDDNITNLERKLLQKEIEFNNLTNDLNKLKAVNTKISKEIATGKVNLENLNHNLAIQGKMKGVNNDNTEIKKQLNFYEAQIAKRESVAAEFQKKQQVLEEQERYLKTIAVDLTEFNQERATKLQQINIDIIKVKEEMAKLQTGCNEDETVFLKEKNLLDQDISIATEKQKRLFRNLEKAKKLTENLKETYSKMKGTKSSFKTPVKSPGIRKVTFNQYVTEREITDESSDVPSSQNLN